MSRQALVGMPVFAEAVGTKGPDPVEEVLRSSEGTEIARPHAFVWAGTALGFGVAHAPADGIETVVRAVLPWLGASMARLEGASGTLDPVEVLMAHVLVPLKSLCFVLALAALLYPLVASVRAEWPRDAALPWRRLAVCSLLVFLSLCALAIPLEWPRGFTSSFGNNFARMSLDPFGEPSGLVHRRLLVPALAHFLQMKGLVLYIAFTMFNLWFLVLALCVFLQRRSAFALQATGSGRADAACVLCWTSIATSSFVLAHFQFSGLADHLAATLALLMLAFPMSGAARLACLTLGLLVHEASAFLLVPIVFLGARSWSVRMQSIAIPLLYAAFWLVSYRFDIEAMRAIHGADTATRGVLSDPAIAVAGMLASFKLLWLAVPAAIVALWRAGRRSSALEIAVMAAAPIPLLFVATDLSRLAGYAFPAVLLSLVVLSGRSGSGDALRTWTPFFALNLLIPSYWIQSTGVVYLRNGLYDVAVGASEALLAGLRNLLG